MKQVRNSYYWFSCCEFLVVSTNVGQTDHWISTHIDTYWEVISVNSAFLSTHYLVPTYAIAIVLTLLGTITGCCP